MFKGEESITLSTTQPEAAVQKKVEEALSVLGRVKIDKRGGIEIAPKAKFTTTFTDVTMEGSLRKRGDGYDLAIEYACKPTIVTWLIVVLGTLTLFFGWLAIFVPMSAKKKVGKAVEGALMDLEDGMQTA